jgi:hypothetical protein
MLWVFGEASPSGALERSPSILHEAIESLKLT